MLVSATEWTASANIDDDAVSRNATNLVTAMPRFAARPPRSPWCSPLAMGQTLHGRDDLSAGGAPPARTADRGSSRSAVRGPSTAKLDPAATRNHPGSGRRLGQPRPARTRPLTASSSSSPARCCGAHVADPHPDRLRRRGRRSRSRHRRRAAAARPSQAPRRGRGRANTSSGGDEANGRREEDRHDVAGVTGSMPIPPAPWPSRPAPTRRGASDPDSGSRPGSPAPPVVNLGARPGRVDERTPTTAGAPRPRRRARRGGAGGSFLAREGVPRRAAGGAGQQHQVTAPQPASADVRGVVRTVDQRRNLRTADKPLACAPRPAAPTVGARPRRPASVATPPPRPAGRIATTTSVDPTTTAAERRTVAGQARPTTTAAARHRPPTPARATTRPRGDGRLGPAGGGCLLGQREGLARLRRARRREGRGPGQRPRAASVVELLVEGHIVQARWSLPRRPEDQDAVVDASASPRVG